MGSIMKKNLKIIIGMLFLLFSGCATQTQFGNYIYPEGSINGNLYTYKVVDENDEMNDLKRISQQNNGSVPDQFPGDDFVFYSLNLRFIHNKNGKDILYLVPNRYGDGWLFMESLTIKVDGVKKEWKWESWDRKSEVIYGGTTMEWTFIQLSKNDIEELINAKEITARLTGSKYYSDIPIMEYVQSNWKSFYQQYLSSSNIE